MENDKINKIIKQNHELFELLRVYKDIDKTELADRLKLSVPTIYKNIEDLNKYNLIIKDNQLNINNDFGTFVGISIGSSLCKIVFLHFSLEIYTNEEFSDFKKMLVDAISKYIKDDNNFSVSMNSNENYIYFSTPTKFKEIKDILNSIFDSLIEFNCSKTFNLLGIGISSTGVVNEQEQMIHQAHNLPELENRTLLNLFTPSNKEYFIKNNVNVSLIQNSNASVICEKVALYQHKSQYMFKKNIVSIYLGVGLGAGFVFNGDFYSGTHGFVGEIGHMDAPCYEKLEDKVKIKTEDNCTCGKCSCYDYKIRTYIFEKSKSEFGKMNSSDIYNYLSNNPEKAKYLGKYLGSLVNMLSTLLNIDLVIIGGKLKKSMILLNNDIDSEKDDNPFKFNRIDCDVAEAYEGARSPSIGAAIYSYYKKYGIPCTWNI